MITQYHDILQGFEVDELKATVRERDAFRACAELMLCVSVDFATATSLAMLLLANKKGCFSPNEDFAEKHPENRPDAYSGDVAYLAFCLLFLCEKARSIKDILDDQERCPFYSVSCGQDLDTCGRCEDRTLLRLPSSGVQYENAPPFHLGCRCRPLLLREGDLECLSVH